MLQKFLSSIGIGAATVDTEIKNPVLRIGETIYGVVRIKGGNVKQDVDKVAIKLISSFKDNDRTFYATLASCVVASNIKIKPNEEKNIPFSFVIPPRTPISNLGNTHVYIRTIVDIDDGVDPTDNDKITILPDTLMEQIFLEIEEGGFRHTHDSGECDYEREFQFVQEFEMIPESWSQFYSLLDEIELVFIPIHDGYRVYLQTDKKGNFILNHLDEKNIYFEVSRKQGFAKGEIIRLIRENIV